MGPRPRFIVLHVVVLAAGGLGLPAHPQEPTPRQLGELSLEQLGNIQVTSVSKRPERLQDAAASIYVITSEDIRRSGATRLPEILRLAPNLEVAQVRAFQYAISARGFNNAASNKLLVLIDGRTVYTPLFSSVFWEDQDLVVEDIERIEVVSGAGGTLWGVNAVNGVVNIISRSAAATGSSLVTAQANDEGDRRASLRHGGPIGENARYRVYMTGFELGNTRRADGVAILDGWRHGQVGMRSDWAQGRDDITLQADAYRGRSDHRGFAGAFELTPIRVSGANVLARWSRELDSSMKADLQAYVDHSRREEVVLFGPRSTIYDLEAQLGGRGGAHQWVAGFGHRVGLDSVTPGAISAILPVSRTLHWSNLFLQDEYAITGNLDLTAGIKMERNSYSGWEYLPTLRFAWHPRDDRLIWGSASRAVRAPARLDRDVFFPASPPFVISGGPDFESEVANVYELGYRGRLAEAINASVTAFVHDWDRLRSGQRAPGVLVNQIRGIASGVEAWADWRPTRDWRLSAGGMRLNMKLDIDPASTDTVGVRNANLANDPLHQWSLRSSHDLPANLELDVALRAVGALANTPTPAYRAVDARLGWRPTRQIDIALVARNLLDKSHFEIGSPTTASVLRRSLGATIAWRF